MGRLAEKGLSYFSVATTWETEVKLVKAKYGALEGVGFLVELWASIYRENYYRVWNEETELLFADEIKKPVAWVHEVVEYCFDKGIFDRVVYEAKGVLTNHGIQKRYFKIASTLGRDYIDYIEGLTYPEFMPENKVPGNPDKVQRNADKVRPYGDKVPSYADKAKQANSKQRNSEERCAREGPPVDNSERASLDAYLQMRLSKAKKVGDPESWLSKMRAQDDVIAAWRKWEADEEKRKPLPSPPSCDCESEGDLLDYAMGPGGIRKLPRNKRVCAQCGKLWEFDDDFGQWGPVTTGLDDFEKTG